MVEALTLEPDVLRAAGGDRQAFGRLVDATRTTVCSIALAVVRDVEASEDVAQDVYMHAWRGLPTLRSASSFIPWLRQLARNRAHAFLRKDQPARRRPMDESVEAVLVDDRPGPEEGLLLSEERQAIREALDELNTDAREVLILFYREEQSVRQVATLLDLSEAAVKKRLERARDGLRTAVERRLSEALVRTKPGAAFSFTVIAMLPPLIPTAASVGKSVLIGAGLSKIGALIGSTVFSTFVGVGSLLFGYRKLLRKARDEEERRGVIRLAILGVVMQAAVVVPMPWVLERWHYRSVLVGWFVLLMLSMWIQLYWAVPRITARRLALERAEDPDAAVRQRREKLVCNLGFVIGMIAGGTGVLFALSRFQ